MHHMMHTAVCALLETRQGGVTYSRFWDSGTYYYLLSPSSLVLLCLNIAALAGESGGQVTCQRQFPSTFQ